MDRFFDKLGDLLQSLLGGDSAGIGGYDMKDPDMREAVEELDAYLESGASQRRTAGPGASQRRTAGPGASRDQSLRRDYATLEVAVAAPLVEVKKSYKRLLHKYHPDRFSGDAEKQALANEVTQRLNQAFDRIERRHGGGGG